MFSSYHKTLVQWIMFCRWFFKRPTSLRSSKKLLIKTFHIRQDRAKPSRHMVRTIETVPGYCCENFVFIACLTIILAQEAEYVNWWKLKRFACGSSHVVYNIMTGDWCWIYSDDPEEKYQPALCMFQNEL